MKCCPNRRLCWKCPIAISAGRVGRYVMATVRNDPMIIKLAHKTRHHMGHKRKEETAQRDTEHAAKTALGTCSITGEAALAVGMAKTTLHWKLNGGKTRAEAREQQQQPTGQEEKILVDWNSHDGLIILISTSEKWQRKSGQAE